VPLSGANEVKAPVLGLYDAEDASITPDQVEAMKERLNAAGKTAKFKIYPGAGHGFFADYRQSFPADAAQDAWQSMQAWFKKYKVLGYFLGLVPSGCSQASISRMNHSATAPTPGEVLSLGPDTFKVSMLFRIIQLIVLATSCCSVGSQIKRCFLYCKA
jgi:hypothetical protein